MDAPLLIGTNHVYRVTCWDQIDGQYKEQRMTTVQELLDLLTAQPRNAVVVNLDHPASRVEDFLQVVL